MHSSASKCVGSGNLLCLSSILDLVCVRHAAMSPSSTSTPSRSPTSRTSTQRPDYPFTFNLQPPVIAGKRDSQKVFSVPLDGISVNGAMYLFYSLDSVQLDPNYTTFGHATTFWAAAFPTFARNGPPCDQGFLSADARHDI
jgi:hypothetical protein